MESPAWIRAGGYLINAEAVQWVNAEAVWDSCPDPSGPTPPGDDPGVPRRRKGVEVRMFLSSEKLLRFEDGTPGAAELKEFVRRGGLTASRVEPGTSPGTLGWVRAGSLAITRGNLLRIVTDARWMGPPEGDPRRDVWGEISPRYFVEKRGVEVFLAYERDRPMRFEHGSPEAEDLKRLVEGR